MSYSLRERIRPKSDSGWKTIGVPLLFVLSQISVFSLLWIGWRISPSHVVRSHDAGWFISIARVGYVNEQQTVFMPLFPILISIIHPFFGYEISALFLSEIFALLFLVVFREFSSLYSSSSEDLSTIFLFIPAFTSVAILGISDSLFLLLSLLSWLNYRRNRIPESVFFLSLSAITRSSGIGIAVPAIIFLLAIINNNKKLAQAVPIAFIPIVCLLGYFYILFGNPLVTLHAAQKYWHVSLSYPLAFLFENPVSQLRLLWILFLLLVYLSSIGLCLAEGFFDLAVYSSLLLLIIVSNTTPIIDRYLLFIPSFPVGFQRQFKHARRILWLLFPFSLLFSTVRTMHLVESSTLLYSSTGWFPQRTLIGGFIEQFFDFWHGI